MFRGLLLLCVVILLGSTSISAAGTPVATPDEGEVFVGAGDIASCDFDGDEATARLLDEIEGTIFTLGDNAYDNGTPEEFAQCYDPTWGRHIDRTRPVPGNHDYHIEGAQGYFDYFGTNAGEPGQGWYSYDLGDWHIVALNTNCDDVGGCGEGSAQHAWLEADLAAHPSQCTLAYMHHPLFSSGGHGDEADLAAIWATLYASGAEMVLAGHDHTYERFAPMAPDGTIDPERGIVQFVVGTGGGPLRDFGEVHPHSHARNSESFGVLQLTLLPGGYEWEFVPVEGESFTDIGNGSCH
jgi:3',5'-cyclic AMP phosphodiesterase CpdA